MYEPRKRLDVGTWGIMGIGMGFAVAAAVVTGKPVIAIEGDSAFGFSGMEVETICRYNLPVCVVVFNNNGVYRGTDVNPTGGPDVAPTVFVKGARYDKLMEAFGGIGVHATTADELAKALERSGRLRQADPDQRRHRRNRRHRERPHHQPEPAKRSQRSNPRTVFQANQEHSYEQPNHSKASRSSTSRTCRPARPAPRCWPGSAPT